MNLEFFFFDFYGKITFENYGVNELNHLTCILGKKTPSFPQFHIKLVSVMKIFILKLTCNIKSFGQKLYTNSLRSLKTMIDLIVFFVISDPVYFIFFFGRIFTGFFFFLFFACYMECMTRNEMLSHDI